MRNFPQPPSVKSIKIHLKPYIPTKVLEQVLDNIVPRDTPTDDILVVIPDGVFFNAKSGIVITKEHIYTKEILLDTHSAYVSECSDIWCNIKLLSSELYIDVNDGEKTWKYAFNSCSKKEAPVVTAYIKECIKYLNDNVVQEQEESQKANKIDEEKLREEIRKQLIFEEEKRKFEEEKRRFEQEKAQFANSQSNFAQNKIPVPVSMNDELDETEIDEDNYPQNSSYFGTRIDDSNEPEPPYFGEIVEDDEEIISTHQNTAATSKDNSVLGNFLQNNSDGIIAKLKTSGLGLTAAALQNDDNISRIANFIYNMLPGPVRFVVSISTVENFLLNNRYWLIEKLK